MNCPKVTIGLPTAAQSKISNNYKIECTGLKKSHLRELDGNSNFPLHVPEV